MSRDASTEGEFHRLAREKMSTVLGAARAEILIERILSSTGITLETADDLFVFSTELAKYGGFEGAVGGLLNVRAVLSGGRRPKPAA